MLRVHLRPLDGGEHDVDGIAGAMAPLGRGLQPVVVVGRHQHELAAAVAGDLHRLALRLVLVLAELALELEREGYGAIAA